MKKRVVLLLTFALVGISFYLIINSIKPKEIHYVGKYSELLHEDLDSNEIASYCSKQGLNFKNMIFYEGEFSVFKNGAIATTPTLPIYNPEEIKSILAVYSSIPLNSEPQNDINSLRLQYDKEWFEKQPHGKLKEPLTVKYLMEINDLSALPDQDLISNTQSESLIKEVAENPELGAAKQLADKIRMEMPPESRDNLKQLLIAYCLWIKKNISYPEKEYFSQLRGEYINLSISKSTIESKLGVCEDYANLLKDFLNSQGIEAYYVTGIRSKNPMDPSLLPIEDNAHAVILIKTSEGYYLVDPTTQSLKNTIPMTLSDGRTIKISNREQNDNLRIEPMYISEIEGFYMTPSDLSFVEMKIKKIRH